MDKETIENNRKRGLKEQETRRQELENNFLTILSKLMDVCYPKGLTYNEIDPEVKEVINELVKKAFLITMEMDVNLNPEYEVYADDIVTLLDDNGEDKTYYLTNLTKTDDIKDIEQLNVLGRVYTMESLGVLKTYEGLGSYIVGKRVGDTVEYSEDEAKNYCKYTIIATIKTPYSYRYVNNQILDNYVSRHK